MLSNVPLSVNSNYNAFLISLYLPPFCRFQFLLPGGNKKKLKKCISLFWLNLKGFIYIVINK